MEVTKQEFKVGDRVRLRARPDIEAVVESTAGREIRYRTVNGGTNWRWPEELELLPEPKAVEVPEGMVAVILPKRLVEDEVNFVLTNYEDRQLVRSAFREALSREGEA